MEQKEIIQINPYEEFVAVVREQFNLAITKRPTKTEALFQAFAQIVAYPKYGLLMKTILEDDILNALTETSSGEVGSEGALRDVMIDVIVSSMTYIDSHPLLNVDDIRKTVVGTIETIKKTNYLDDDIVSRIEPELIEDPTVLVFYALHDVIGYMLIDLEQTIQEQGLAGEEDDPTATDSSKS